MKKILVIHPTDKSTDFLIPIYLNKECTIIRHELSRSELTTLILQHDEIRL